MSNHGDTERKIIELFKKSKEFDFENTKYKIIKIGKPRPSRGECKTDIYILGLNESNNETKEFKISIKQSDADFLENKMSLDRAKEIFGTETKEILTKSILSVKNDFLEDDLICFQKKGRTESQCIKIGWKFEFINKDGGKRSGKMLLTDNQKIEIYSGSNLNVDKKNAKVEGEVIINSGIANYILEVNNTDNILEHHINNLIQIENYAVSQDIYFACKALNYRTQFNKWDGDRPLSVYINWQMDGTVLKAEFVMDCPLEKKGNEIAGNIVQILNKLKINTHNFEQIKKHLDSKIKTYNG